MPLTGSCHCGKVQYEVDAEIENLIECNCSHCSRKGYLLFFVPRGSVRFKSGETDLATYTFNKHVIEHKFCPTCGAAPLGFGTDPKGDKTAAINARLLENVDWASIPRVAVDGKSY